MSKQLEELKRHIEGCCESMNRGIRAARKAGMYVNVEMLESGDVHVHVSHVKNGVYTLAG